MEHRCQDWEVEKMGQMTEIFRDLESHTDMGDDFLTQQSPATMTQ
jgi:hypothetical protein